MSKSTTEHANLIAIGVAATANLREFCRKDGIPGLGDFLNGLLIAGLSLEDRIEGEGDFVGAFHEEMSRADEIMASKSFEEFKGRLASRELAEVVAEKSQLSLIVAIACEGKFIEVAQDIRMKKDEMLRCMAIGAVATVCDASDEEDLPGNLAKMAELLEEKRASVKELRDMTDEEMFGSEWVET